MKKLLQNITAVFAILVSIALIYSPLPAHAADVRAGQTVIVSENQKNLTDLYLFGGDVQLSSPVTNDLVSAGGNINLSGDVSNDLLAAGGTIVVNGKIANTARIAGGNITIDGPVARDLAVAGGTVTIGKTAAIGGDLLIAGGQLIIDGPVHGKILMSGGNITLNSAVDGNVIAGQAGTLTLGPQAKINGNLTYSSANPATMESGSIVRGQTTYHHVEKQHKEQSAQSWIGIAFYQMLVEIILSLLLIYFFKKGLLTILTHMKESPWKDLGIGFVYVALTPLVSLILLILFPLGIASFLLYLLILIVSIFLRDIFAGWLAMKWWDNRSKKEYVLDWKAGVIGPIILFLINLIPILGWLVSAIICLIGIGALLANLMGLVPQLQTLPKKK